MSRSSVFLAALAVAVGGAVPVFGQAPEAPFGQLDPLAVVRAPVVIDGEELFSVRGITAYPAERRAAEIEARIRALARNTRAGTPVLTRQEMAGATWILANGQPFLTVRDEDAALEAVDRQILAEAYQARIANAIAAYRTARQPAVLWRNAFLTVAATLLLLAAAFICRRVVGWLHGRIERRYRDQVGDVRILSFEVLRADQLWRALAGVLSFLWVFTVIALVAVHLRYTLSLFPWTRGTAKRLVEIVVEPVRSMGLGLVGVIPNFIFLAMLFLVVRYALRLIRVFFDNIDAGTLRLPDFDRDWARPTFKIVRLFVIAFAAVVAYPYVPGSDTEAFKGVSLFIGVVFSLGSTSLIGNIISGYSLTYSRTFRVGDRVRIGEHLGAVIDTRLLVTHIRTPWNEEVIVPNSSIVSTEVVNYSSMARAQGLILHTTVGIRYETPWRQVEALLVEAAARTPGLPRDRPPFVHQKSLGEFCVTYEINVFCDTPERMRSLYSDLHRNILDVFNEYGVQIMTPAYEGDPSEPKVVPKEQWFTAPAQPAGSTGEGEV